MQIGQRVTIVSEPHKRDSLSNESVTKVVTGYGTIAYLDGTTIGVQFGPSLVKKLQGNETWNNADPDTVWWFHRNGLCKGFPLTYIKELR